ncbi:MAG: site-specific DNA-methyltransferase [Gallionellales bacterium 35-53-114]|jgi:adenine-specific DNA-methyltransferase|nr:MAG: site-specific DNA-methyltransferase [Gallionellales bacterium 35-53-114]OYZ64986.1 MAG: site-specific DNA-methyltransferase [Gallionellales bacterium 24-53-125]OZB07831.1 MAG: site-specific DNA-methyltransferase [Gallionellales bacterium 39-52-133]HQS58734.1 site-specific DNA-methyltransferase [Gallionellaceae bacterium]HQS75074.1 site-specific DNA-methyltransferase [Gallionellaceae bacterium]
MNKQKLELTWIGKENRPKLEPRILLEDPAKSYHAKHRVTDNDIFDNQLIFGDNLLALKALEAEFAGKVKCVFIDPPYNTGSAFEHYDDGVEHSIWLSLMRDRLEIIRHLLSEDGSLWITIDDNECHYLKVLCDEVFGRPNFVASVIWRKNYAPKSSAKHFSVDHDYVLIYAKNGDIWKPNPMPRSEKQDKAYKNMDNDPRGLWRPNNLAARNFYSKGTYSITCPSGRVIEGPPPGSYWRVSKEKFMEMDKDGRIWWGKDGGNVPAPKIYLSEVKQGIVPQTFWDYEEVGHTQDAKREAVALFSDDVFGTPKPERLMKRIVEVATNNGDIILDSFAGSGTTGAVAHKLGRRWIMVELGEHCHTHIIPRLQKVIDGEDNGGISEAVNWQGGGGFRYYKLAPSLLRQDAYGQWVINKEYNPEMLAQALCKLEGFTYAPSDAHYWMHGHSTEQDFIYVTTANLNHEQMQKLSDEVGVERSLLVLCTAFRGKGEYPNLTVKKIPKQVLSRCEWGHDDYSLRVENLPKAPLPSPLPLAGEGIKAKGRSANVAQGGLFEEGEA